MNPHELPLHVAIELAGTGHGEHSDPHDVTELFVTHTPPHWWKPATHIEPHIVPSHVATEFGGTGHGEHDVPHEFTLVLLTHAPPQRWYPALQVKPQLVPSHVAVAFDGTGQTAHDGPHDVGLIGFAHVAPHATNPVLHASPQLVPSHVAIPFAGTAHGEEQVVPQVVGSVLLAHVVPHKWKPALQVYPQPPPVHRAVECGGAAQTLPHEPQLFASIVTSVHMPPQRLGVGDEQPDAQTMDVPDVLHSGTDAGQTVPQLPQFIGELRLVSQPSSAEWLQSANPGSHVKPQFVPSHVGTAFGGDEQAVHPVPHELIDVLSEHVAPHK